MTAKLLGLLTTAVFTIAGCGGADPCEELKRLTAEQPEVLAVDAADPDGVMNACIGQIEQQWQEMTPAEREAFLRSN
jgi:hypothetical protein